MAIGKLLNLGLRSSMEEAVERAPGKMPVDQVPSYMKGAGVTDDEMKFSGFTDQLPASGPVTKTDLQSNVANRKDSHGVVEFEGDQAYYSSVSDIAAKDPSYREHVFTFTKKDDSGPATSSVHFPEVDNYIAHTRSRKGVIDGSRAHVVLELQSDVKAAQRTGGSIPREQLAKINASSIASGDPEALQAFEALLLPNGPAGSAELDSFKELFLDLSKKYGHEAAMTDLISRTAVQAETPYNRNMYKKLLERSVALAQTEGTTSVAVPISDVATLQRGGNQAIYRDIVPKQMQKIAKQNGWVYKEVEETAEPIIASSTKSTQFINRALSNASAVFDLHKDIKQGPDADFVSLAHNYVSSIAEDLTDLGLPIDNAAVVQSLLQGLDDVVANSSTAKDLFAQLNERALGLVQPKVIKYAVIDMADKAGALKPPTKGFTLYSSPAAGAFAAYSFMSAGFSDKEVATQLKKDGYSEEDADEFIANGKLVSEFYAMDIPEAEVRAFFDAEEPEQVAEETKNPTPLTPAGSYWHNDQAEPPRSPVELARLPTLKEQYAQDAASLEARRARETHQYSRDRLLSDEEMTVHELLGHLRVMYPSEAAPHTMIAAWGGSEASLRIMEETQASAEKHIVKSLKDRLGVEAVYDEEYGGYVDATTGEPLDHGFWRNLATDLDNSGALFTMSLVGAAEGARFGSVATSSLGPVGKAAGTFIGGVLGGAFGGAVGSQLDYFRSAMKIDEEMRGEIMARKALNEAEIAVIGDVAFAALLKVGKATGGKAKEAVSRIIEFARSKDTKGAERALKEYLYLSDDELQEISDGLSSLTTFDGATPTQQKIGAAVLTQPGGEAILEAVVRNTPKASQALIRSINDRAQSLAHNVDDIRDPAAALRIVNDLDSYQKDVKGFFTDVKNAANTSTKKDAYFFDIDKLGVVPALDDLKKSIADPMTRIKLFNKISNVKHFSKTRSFHDLLELRQIVNGIIHSGKGEAKKLNELRSTLNAIDAEISKGAELALDNPTQWKADWKAANAAYSEMKRMEKNVLFKALTKPGLRPEQIANSLTQYIGAIDNTYVEVMSKMPRQTRVAVEAEIFAKLSDKYTLGSEGGWKVTDFPALAEQLKSMPFTSPEARKLQQAILRMADVFRNDVQLAKISGEIPLPRFQSYLTADPVIRAKFAVASGVFKKVKELTPGETQRNMALVNVVTELLDKPLNAKLLDDLVKEAGSNIEVTEAAQELAQAAARMKADKADLTSPKVRLYGSGNILSVSNKGALQQADTLPLHRIASQDEANTIALSNGVNPQDIKAVDELLSNLGYKAVQHGTNRVRRLSK